MSDIFLSYDSADRATARRFADALESLGWPVWWDREIPLGKAFDQVIEKELNEARCIIVLWSRESVRSRWVKTEASVAADRECLIPVVIDAIEIPLEFKRIQTAMLMNWQGDAAAPEFAPVIEAVKQLVERDAAAAPIASQATTVERKPLHPRPPRRGMLLLAAAALAITVGAVALKTLVHKIVPSPGPDASAVNPPVDKKPAGEPSDSAAVGGTTAWTPPKGAIAINIGDKIDDGVPAAGAGSMEAPYSQDIYVFNAAAKQRVYFRLLRQSAGMSYINWRLTDADGAEVFNTCFGCGEVGVQNLVRAGPYALTVGSDRDPATGTYRLQLVDVPWPSRYSIKIGDAIKENQPGAGAGVIESPGAEDVYEFKATPRQRVYFRVWEQSTGMDYINWNVVDENGMEVFDTCLGCGEPGVRALVNGGTYTLTVGNQKDPSTGTYRLQLYNVPPPDQFTIKSGDRVRPGAPGIGAGAIESPGAEDVYVFNAAPGQRMYVRILDRDKGTDYINWRLDEDNGMKLFESCFGCGEPGVQTLTRGGSYSLTVGNPGNPATGQYSFELGSQ